MNYSKFVLFVLLFSFGLPAHAQFKTAKIRNFKGSYKNPIGTASALEWTMGGDSITNATFDLVREESQLRLAYDGGDIILEEVPEFFLLASSANISGLYLTSSGSRSDFSLYRFSSAGQGKGTGISNVKLTCTKKSSYTTEWEKYLDACTANGTVSIQNITTTGPSKLSKGLHSLVQRSVAAQTTTIERFSFTTKNNQMNLSVKVGKRTLKLAGTIKYTKAGGKNIISIKFKRSLVAFGLVNELAKQNIPGLKTSYPSVTYSF